MIERMFDCPNVDNEGRLVLDAGQVAHDTELVLARRVASWHAVEGWKVDGSRSAAAWLVWKLCVSYYRACSLIRLGQALISEPLIAAALDEHRLSLGQVEPIISVGTPEREYEYHRDLAVMIREAAGLSVAQVRVMAKHWADLTDQAQTSAAPIVDPVSKLHIAETLDGIVEVNGTLRGDHGALILAAIQAAKRLSQPNDDDDDDDDPEGDHENGSDVPSEKPIDSRSESEKAADALAVISSFFLDHHDRIGTRHGERAHVQVAINLEALTTGLGHATSAQLRAGLSAEQARQMACDCNVTRVLTIGKSDVIDVGRAQRIIPVALRKALLTRDRHCRGPGCVMPGIYLDGHHITHWANGGLTNLDNCVLLCRYHHRLVHIGRWTLVGNPNQQVTLTSPTGTPHTSRPPGQLHPG